MYKSNLGIFLLASHVVILYHDSFITYIHTPIDLFNHQLQSLGGNDPDPQTLELTINSKFLEVL